MLRHVKCVALAAALTLLAQSALAAEKIVIAQWDAYWPPDLLANFTKDTGIETEWTVIIDNEDMMGKVTAGGGKGLDVVFASGPFVEALAQLGLITELDHAKLPNLANLYAEARNLPFDPGNKFSIPYTWGTTGLCYRSDLVQPEPTSWNDLLKPADNLKGKITMLSTDRWLMAAGAKALGYSVNTTDPAELAAMRDLLVAAKKNLLAYDDTTFYSKLVSGEALLVHAWDGWCNFGIAENPAIKFVVPTEGSDLWVDAMVVTSASEHKEAAHAFLDYIMRPDVAASIVGFTFYKVPNAKAVGMLDQTLLTTYPSLAISSEMLFQQEQLRDLGDGQKDFTRVVTEILAAQ